MGYLRELGSPSVTIDPPRVRDVLLNHSKFSGSVARVREVLQKDLQEAEALARETWAAYSHISRYGRMWDAPTFVSQEPSFEELTSEMRRMAEFSDELDTGRFRSQRSVGKLIMLDGRSLREQLTSVPGSVLPV